MKKNRFYFYLALLHKCFWCIVFLSDHTFYLVVVVAAAAAAAAAIVIIVIVGILKHDAFGRFCMNHCKFVGV